MGEAPVTYEQVRALALALPGVEEESADATPALRVRGRLLAWLREDGVLVVRAERAEREARIAADPASFFVTDHYLSGPWLLVRLEATGPDALGELLRLGWRELAPKRLQRELDGR